MSITENKNSNRLMVLRTWDISMIIFAKKINGLNMLRRWSEFICSVTTILLSGYVQAMRISSYLQ